MIINLFKHKVDRSDISHAILEKSSRIRKAAKIQAIMNEVTDFTKAKILDVGTGSGQIAHEFSKTARKVSSIDVVDERRQKGGYNFYISKDDALPFKSNSFDIVVANHVIEHIPNQKTVTQEMIRVLKPGGFLYLSTPNKYWLNDPHYKLPFISWLPRSASQRYLQLTQKAKWDIYPLSTFGIRRRFKGNTIIDGVVLLLKSKAFKKLDTWELTANVARFMPTRLLSLIQYFGPTLIFIIQKPAKKA